MIKKLLTATNLAGLGVALFAICGALIAFGGDPDLSTSVTEKSCKDHFDQNPAKNLQDDDKNGVLRIMGVWPERTQLGGSLCVAAAGIASLESAGALNNVFQRKRGEMQLRVAEFERAQKAVTQKLDEAQKLDTQIDEAVAASRPLDELRRKQTELNAQLEGLIKKAGTEEQKYRQALTEQEAARTAAEKGPALVKVTLFLGGKRANNLTLNAFARPDVQYLVFKLDPAVDATSEAGQFWRDVLGGTTNAVDGQSKDDRYRVFDIGLSRQESSTAPELSVQPPVNLLIYRLWLVGLGGAAALCLMAAFSLQARSTSLLRDHDAVDPATGLPQGPYSLARSQMAMWGALVFFGFIYIWLTLGHVNGILNEKLLLLLGITAATGLIAVQITNAQGVADTVSSGSFWKDILQSGSAPQIHRIQMVAWSLLLAVIFSWYVITTFTFMQFDTNLLIMMGFVGGTYLGFKPSEN